jgi:uncharacterized protein YkwD
LCGVAEALLGWDREQDLDEHTLRFISWYFGLPSPPSKVLFGQLETDDPKAIAKPLLEPLTNFGNTAARPRFGMATQRFHRKSKTVLVLQDPEIELDLLPHRMNLNSQASFTGHLLGDLVDPKALIGDAAGGLVAPSFPGGKTFQTILRCGSRKGSIEIEIHGLENGADKVVTRFPVGCGIDLSTSVSLAPPQQRLTNVQEQERRIFEVINAERASAGLDPIAWDDAVAGVARTISENRRDAARSQSAPSTDLVQLLKQARVPTRLVRLSPGRGPTPEDAHMQLSRSLDHRSNYINQDVTNAGIGIANATDDEGHRIAYLTEVFTKKLPRVDPEAVREELHSRIARKRADGVARSMARDSQLEEVAQTYVRALVASNGALSNTQSYILVRRLQRSYREINILSAAKADPLEMVESPEIVGKADRLGIGVAEGAHPLLGNHAIYVVILLGTRR